MSRVIHAGFWAVLAIIVGNGVLAYVQIRRIAEDNRWMHHTRGVLLELERTLALLTDAETGQRGYLLTGQDDYLGPYREAAGGLAERLDRLASLTSDNPRQRGLVADLRRLAGEKTEELRRTIALHDGGDRRAALEVVRSGRGKRVMDEARRAIAAMRDEEYRLLERRTEAVRAATTGAIVSIAVATASALALLLAVAALKRRDDLRRQEDAEALRQEREWLATTLASIGEAVIATDGARRVRLMNPVAEALTGWTQAEAAGRPIAEVFRILNQETREPAEDPTARVIREGIVAGLADRTVVVARDGRETPVEDSAAPIRDASGRIVGVVMVFVDASERRSHEAALRLSEDRLRLATEATGLGVWDYDPQTQVAQASEKCKAAFGLRPDEALTYETFLAIIHEADRGRVHAANQRALGGEDGGRYDIEYRSIGRNDGVERHLAVRGQAHFDESGRPVRFVGTVLDITGRKRAEAALREGEKRSRAILESITDGFFALDRSWRFTYLNRQAEALLGRSRDDLLGKVLWEEYPGTVGNDIERRYRLAMDGGDAVEFEEFYPPHDRWYENHLYPSEDGLSVYFRDITGRKLADAELRASEERRRLALDSAELGEWHIDPSFTLTTDERFRMIFHGSTAPLTYEQAFAAVHPGDRERVEAAVAAATRLGDPIPFAEEYRVVHPDGSVRWVFSKGRSQFESTASGRRLASYDGTVMDIDERRRAEERLRESEAQFRTMADNLPQLAWMARPDGYIFWYNRRWYDYTGTTPEQMEGWGWQAVHDPAELPRVLEKFRAAVAGGELWEDTFPLRRHDGQMRWHLSRMQPVRDERGRVSRWFGTNTDITDRLAMEAALRRAKEEAEGANRAKDDFIAVLSHELRTPLNPVLLATTAMLDRPTPPEEFRPTLEMIRQNVGLQARLIDDLLDVMRIVRGKMPLHWSVADFHEIIGRAVEICRSEAHAKGLRLTLDLAAGPRCVNGDAARLQQVVWNLLKNAIKFTPEGGAITVRTRNEGEAIVLEVEDAGIGIEPDVLPHVFDAFHQGDARITRKFGGLGLGLAICRGVVEAHGGTIAAESPGRDRGATLRIALKTIPVPVGVPPGGAGDGDAPTPGPGPGRLGILVVEDDPTTLQLLARLLRSRGHEVTAAGTVAEALEAYRRAYGFDLIVSDIGLPDGTGLDLMRRIRAVRPVPGIALTGFGMDEDIRRSREAGFTTHMTKPIDFTKLEAMIRQVAT